MDQTNPRAARGKDGQKRFTEQEENILALAWATLDLDQLEIPVYMNIKTPQTLS